MRPIDYLHHIGVTMPTSGLRNFFIAHSNLNGLMKTAARHRERMMKTVKGLRQIFSKEIVRGVAIIARCYRAMTGFEPGIIMGLHHMAVRAGLGIIGKVRRPLGINKGIEAHAHAGPHQNCRYNEYNATLHDTAMSQKGQDRPMIGITIPCIFGIDISFCVECGSKIRMSLLICAAFPPEIQALQDQAGKDYMTATLGVGLVSAASSIVALLERHRISRVLFTGTCGAPLNTALKIGDVVRAKTIHTGDISVWSQDTFIPEIMPTSVTPTRFLAPQYTLHESDVFCPLAITRSQIAAAILRVHFPTAVENLECFAVAWNATQRKIPFEAILGVSNLIGPEGHNEWQHHHAAVSQHVQRYIQKLLRS